MRSSIFLFGIIRPTNRMLVQPSSKLSAIVPVGRRLEMREARHDGEHAGAREAGLDEFPGVERRVAEGEHAAIAIGPELAAAHEAELHQQRMHADEELAAA